jgi:NADPH2:quinone reductase
VVEPALLEAGTAGPQPHVFPFERAGEAIASLENRSAKGKVVLRIRES